MQTTLVLPDAERQAKLVEALDDLPEPESIDDLSGLFSSGTPIVTTLSPVLHEQWFISTVNPAAPLIKMPGLWLKPGLRLVSYLYRSEAGGVGVVWAVPEDFSTTAQLEKALQEKGNMARLPRPEGALDHPMEAIEGDRSPASFVLASILRRELQELGTLGDRRNWAHHHLIEGIPAKYTWQWRTEQPKDLSPKVRLYPDGHAAVELFSCRVSAPKTLYRHLDRYPPNSYKPESVDKLLAVEQAS
ncbi:MAG: hypothetical protein Fur0046_22870 [Cyanobacteria bacterium J069]